MFQINWKAVAKTAGLVAGFNPLIQVYVSNEQPLLLTVPKESGFNPLIQVYVSNKKNEMSTPF